MSLLCCPVCGAPMERTDGSYCCEKGHTYDRARQNYVNLLPAKRRSGEPGDSLEMIQARSQFLDRGYYRPLAKRLATLWRQEATGRPLALLDAGCGEGSYLEAVAAAIPAGSRLVGIDLSRPALRRAGRRVPEAEFAVANLFALPLADCSVDGVVQVFAPMSAEEFFRVLRPGGLFLSVTPGPRHLWGLKEALYEQIRENDSAIRPAAGLQHFQRDVLEGELHITPQADIEALYRMTPYAWKSSRKAAELLKQRQWLDTPYQFFLDFYRKEKA